MKRTPLLILGAGASRPYGLPTSAELRQIILASEAGERILRNLGVSWRKIYNTVKLYPIPDRYFHWISGHSQAGDRDYPHDRPVAGAMLEILLEAVDVNPDMLRDFRATFFQSQRVSVDAFIAGEREEMAHIARLSIAAVVLLCEVEGRLDGDWYQQLLEAMLRNESAFMEWGLNVLNFNYDRSFERFFSRAVAVRFREAARSQQFLSRFNLRYAYGSVGPLYGPRAERRSDIKDVPYDFVEESTERAAANINLARGGQPPAYVEEFFSSASSVTFLGFGFWPENISFIPFDKIPDGCPIYCSAFGLPNTVVRDVMDLTHGKAIMGGATETALDFVQSQPVFRFG